MILLESIVRNLEWVVWIQKLAKMAPKSLERASVSVAGNSKAKNKIKWKAKHLIRIINKDQKYQNKKQK